MPHAGLVKEILTPLLNELDVRDRTLVELRFGLTTYPRTLEEIGDQLRITREKVRRMERRTLQRLSDEARPLLFCAMVQEATDLREALIEKHGVVQPEELPSRFDSPWRDLAMMTCEMTTDDWTTLCLGPTPDSVA